MKYLSVLSSYTIFIMYLRGDGPKHADDADGADDAGDADM